MPYRVFDHIEVRCPQLGGEVTFGYCRALNDGLPCPKALVCFQYKFPADEYFKRVLKPETYQRIFFNEGPSRMDRLLTTFKAACDKAEQ